MSEQRQQTKKIPLSNTSDSIVVHVEIPQALQGQNNPTPPPPRTPTPPPPRPPSPQRVAPARTPPPAPRAPPPSKHVVRRRGPATGTKSRHRHHGAGSLKPPKPSLKKSCGGSNCKKCDNKFGCASLKSSYVSRLHGASDPLSDIRGSLRY